MSIHQEQREDTVQELDKREPPLRSVNITFTAALTPGKRWPFYVRLRAESWGEKAEIFLSVNKLSSPEAAGLELKDSQAEYPVVGSQHKRRTIDSYWDATRRKAEVIRSVCVKLSSRSLIRVKTFAVIIPLFIQHLSKTCIKCCTKTHETKPP